MVGCLQKHISASSSSPRVVISELNIPGYDLALVDGLHTDEQVLADFEALLPLLAPSCAVVFHDVVAFGMQRGIAAVLERHPDFLYVHVDSARFQNRHGVGIAYRVGAST